MSKWGLVAEFYHYEKGEDAYTFYDEVTYDSYEEAMEAVTTEYGETLVAAANLDIESDPQLKGFNFEDLAPYLIDEQEDLS